MIMLHGVGAKYQQSIKMKKQNYKHMMQNKVIMGSVKENNQTFPKPPPYNKAIFKDSSTLS